MIQVRLRLGQGHPVRSNSSDNLPTRTSYALGIREVVPKSPTQRGEDFLLLLRCVCVFAQTSLTLRELNAL